MFENIRPVAARYAEAATRAERAAARLADHADVQTIFDRYAALVAENGGKARAVAPAVAREVLGYDASVTATPDADGKVSAKGTRVASLARWIQNNVKKQDATPKPYRVAVTGSGDGGPTGTLVITADDPLYAVLVERLGAPSDA